MSSRNTLKMLDKLIIFACYMCIGLLTQTSCGAADEGTYYNPARASSSRFCNDLNAQATLDVDIVSNFIGDIVKNCEIHLMITWRLHKTFVSEFLHKIFEKFVKN